MNTFAGAAPLDEPKAWIYSSIFQKESLRVIFP
jgi:hypothetical protein